MPTETSTQLPALRSTPFSRLWTATLKGLTGLQLRGLNLRGYSSKTVETSVSSVHLLDAKGKGELPPLVLLHGLSSTGTDFTPLLRRLRRHTRRLIIPDLPGHGRSQTPTGGMMAGRVHSALIESLDAVIDEPSVLVGNSLGGLAAIRYAQARPEKILGLVLLSPGGAPMEPQEVNEFTRKFQLDTHKDAVQFMDRVLGKRHWARHVLAWGARVRFGHRNVRTLLGHTSSEHLLKPKDIQDLPAPVLLIWGGEDGILNHQHRQFFVDNLPKGSLVQEPIAFGHAPFLDDAADLAKRILVFTRSLSEPTPH